MQIAVFQQLFPQTDRRIVAVGQERVLDDDARLTARFEDFDEVLQEQKRRLARLDRKVLLHLGSLFAPERRIGHHDVVAVALLYVGDVLRECVGVDDVGGFDAVQDHVHRADDVGQ